MTGTVTEAGTRNPIAQVVVELRDEHGRIASTATDDLGRYRFDVVAPGNYQVVFKYSSQTAVGTAQEPLVVGDRPAILSIAMSLLRRAPIPKPYGAPPARRRVV